MQAASRLLFLTVIVGLLSCAQNQTPVGETLSGDVQAKLNPSGFLSDYSKLTPSNSPDTKGAFIYRNPGKSMSIYKLVILEPVKVHLKEGAAAQKQSPQELLELAHYFDGQIRQNLGSSFPIVEQPGFGVMRIRAALVDAAPNMPVSKGISSTPFVGAAAIEIEFLDSVTGEQIAAAVDQRSGNWRKLSSLGERNGYTKQLLDQWASLMRDGLDQGRGLQRGSIYTNGIKPAFR